MNAGPPGSTGPHAYVQDLEFPLLDADDESHFQRSLRVRPGDPLTIGDGAGAWRQCRFRTGGLDIDGPIVTVARPGPALAIGFALTKGSKPELAIQKLTEIGVDEILPFLASRSISRPDPARMEKQRARWERVCREACMQSRRAWIPHLAALASFDEVLDLGPAVAGNRGGRALTALDRTVLIGPEGGWSSSEIDRLDSVDLGPNVLRAETAAIVAGARMVALRG